MSQDNKELMHRCNVRAKHSGELMGFEPTDVDVDFSGIAIIRVNNGRIVEAWNNFDFLKMNKQLGVL